MTSRNRWAPRIARAKVLAERDPATAELLTFYASLAEYQQGLAEQWQAAAWNPSIVLSAVQKSLSWLERSAPPGLVDVVRGLSQLRSADWRQQLDRYMTGTVDVDLEEAPRVFVIELLLQPLAEVAAARTQPQRTVHDNRCPFCGQLPVVGVLREEGHGTKRTLLCGLCFSEWGYQRIVCPSCGERKFDALPVYTAAQFDAARIEGCDSCRTYLKTIDASKDGTVVPEVDDLATVTLDLWAREHGYTRLRANLLRT